MERHETTGTTIGRNTVTAQKEALHFEQDIRKEIEALREDSSKVFTELNNKLDAVLASQNEKLSEIRELVGDSCLQVSERLGRLTERAYGFYENRAERQDREAKGGQSEKSVL
jgi:hypothetical protein